MLQMGLLIILRQRPRSPHPPANYVKNAQKYSANLHPHPVQAKCNNLLAKLWLGQDPSQIYFKTWLPPIQARADAGDGSALFALSGCKLHGWGMPADDSAGQLLLLKSTEAESPPALALLQRAWALELVPPQAREFDTITALYSQACELGDAVAMFHAGVCAVSGSGCEKDPQLAFELLKASGDQGFLCAKFTAAILQGADADATAAALGGEQMQIKREKGLLQKPRTPKPRVAIAKGAVAQ
jgi:TPR repeat protein